MGVHSLERKQHINASIDDVWNFFSNPDNLADITPAYMNFRVLSGNEQKRIYSGQVITYKVSPLLGIPLFWMTEITHVVPGKLFVDEQRKGPYKLWHHQHHFEENDKGVLMTDIVHYRLPYWFVGEMAHSLFIRKQLNSIFDFRTEVVKKVFV